MYKAFYDYLYERGLSGEEIYLEFKTICISCAIKMRFPF